MEPTSKAGRIRRTKKNQKKKFEFSKLIFAGVSILTISVVIFSCRMIYITGDLSPLAYLIPSVFCGTCHSNGLLLQEGPKGKRDQAASLHGRKEFDRQ
jgi:hypothetical protein